MLLRQPTLNRSLLPAKEAANMHKVRSLRFDGQLLTVDPPFIVAVPVPIAPRHVLDSTVTVRCHARVGRARAIWTGDLQFACPHLTCRSWMGSEPLA